MSKIQELIRAVQSGNLEDVKNLIEIELVNINTSTTVEIKSNTYNGSLYNTTALHEACRQQNHEIVAYLLEKGADVNKLAAVSPADRQDNLIGWTVLHSLSVGCCFEEKLKPAQLSSILEICSLLTKKIQDKKLFDYKIAITSRYDSEDDDQITIEHTAESLASEYERFESISISELIKTMNSSDHFTLEKKAEAPEEEVQFTNLIFSKESLGSVSREFKTRTALPYPKEVIEDVIDYINDTDVLLTQEEKTEQLKNVLSNFIIKLGVYSLQSDETYPEPLGEYYHYLERLRKAPNEQPHYIEKTYWFFAGLLNALWEHQKPMNTETCFIEITDQAWFINTNEILKKAIEETSTFEAVNIEKPKISINIPPNLKENIDPNLIIKRLELLIKSYQNNQQINMPKTISQFQVILNEQKYSVEGKIKKIAIKAEESSSSSNIGFFWNHLIRQRSEATEKLYRLITRCFKSNSTNSQADAYNKLIRHIHNLIKSNQNQPKSTMNLTYTPPSFGR